VRRLATIVLVALCAAIATGCDGRSSESQETVTETETAPPVDGTMRGAVYLLRDGKVTPVERTIPFTLDPERAALLTLLDGPTDDESSIGLSTEIPTGTELLDFTLDDGVATVDLEGSFVETGGTDSTAGRVAQVVATLTRYRTVDRVAFEVDGEAMESIGEVDVAPPVGRAAIEDQTPQILVESPLPGDAVQSPVRLRGTANVFEATVSIEVRDESGEVVLETFTTATSGTGTRGTFATELSLPDTSGKATIVAFEASAEDGRPLHAVEVPVTLTD
jgi:Immunoglobulin-like domain of bacterial spore germination/Sporulation and spore germination